MEPTTTLATGLVKAMLPLGITPVKDFVSQKTRIRRVSSAAVRDAKKRKIGITKRSLRSWLRREDTQESLLHGVPNAGDASIKYLCWLISGSSEDKTSEAIAIYKLVIFHFLKSHSGPEASALGTQQLSSQAIAFKSEITKEIVNTRNEVIKKLREPENLEKDMQALHPWRAEQAVRIATVWDRLSEVVQSLSVSVQPGKTVEEWAKDQPRNFGDAPAEFWCWLGLIAEDYKAMKAARILTERGIKEGVENSDYWRARLVMRIDGSTESGLSEIRNIVATSSSVHPLAFSYLAMAEGKYSDALGMLDRWDVESAEDEAIHSLLRSACLGATLGLNSNITELSAAYMRDGMADTLGLRLAEALLSRGHFSKSLDPLADFIEAAEIAKRVRDFRRTWRGDSVAAALTAIKGAVLSHDVDHAWRLTQLPSDGEASVNEANDYRMRFETAVLALCMGDLPQAENLATKLKSKHLSAYIAGEISQKNDDKNSAIEYWNTAWDEAPDDFARLRTAHVIAFHGYPLPELVGLADRHPESVKSIENLHKVMSKTDDGLLALRTRSTESKENAFYLSERLVAANKYLEAAELQEDSATRWNSLQFMLMAAHSYFRAKKYRAAAQSASKAKTMAGDQVIGQVEALRISLSAHEALGEYEESLVIARRLVQLEQKNTGNRWFLIKCLVRDGEHADAWTTLSSGDELIDPREKDEAKLWISLLSKYSTDPKWITHALRVMRSINDPEVTAAFLPHLITAQGSYENAPKTLTQEINAEIQHFSDEYPTHSSFRVYKGSTEDTLEQISLHLKEREEDPGQIAFLDGISNGDFPVGCATIITGKSHAELVILRVSGLVRSHDTQTAKENAESVKRARGKHVILDTSAAVTIGLLDEETRLALCGEFSVIKSTAAEYRDALHAQESLDGKASLNSGWSRSQQRLVINQITEDEAKRYALRAQKTLQILKATRRRSWDSIKHLGAVSQLGPWTLTVDFALEQKVSLWCDDVAVQKLARAFGVSTFGTADLLRELSDAGAIDRNIARVAESVLISNYHVDLGFNHEIMVLSAELDSWRPAGAAAALSRAGAWTVPDHAIDFFHIAAAKTAEADPGALSGWVECAARGVMAAVDNDALKSSKNIRVLLHKCMTSLWYKESHLFFILRGIRNAIDDWGDVEDPLPQTLGELHQNFIDEYGEVLAKSFLLLHVKNLDERDKNLAARIILTRTRD